MTAELFNDPALLQEVIEHSIDGVITINTKQEILYVNNATCKLFNYTKNELLGQPLSLLVPSPDKSQHQGYIDNYRKTGTKKIIGIGREVEGERKDKTRFKFFLSVSEYKTKDQHFFTGVIHDLEAITQMQNELKQVNQTLESTIAVRTQKLTDAVNKLLKINNKLEKEIATRRKVEHQLKTSENELKQALDKEKAVGDLKSKFVTMASHEFRTPLSTIFSSTNLIEAYAESNKPDKILKHTRKIKKSVNQLVNILNDFLSLGKIDEGKTHTELKCKQLSSLIFESLMQIKELLKPGQIINTTQVNDNVEAYIDNNHFRNIITNLLSNAIKYSPENSEIVIGLEQNSKHITLYVQDSGMGIPKQEQPHVFSRFFRASNALNIGGTGLGLHIIKNYIKEMNGSITFESQENIGTKFIVKLPANDE